MRNGHAPILDYVDEVPLLFDVTDEASPDPETDGLIFALSIHAGLRVSEIAHLTLEAFQDGRGRMTDDIYIAVTKWRKDRTIFKHPEVQERLERYMWAYPGRQWIAASPRDGRQMTPEALGMHMKRRLEEMGFVGCTSHTGRATFITELARRCTEFGCSLWDVMKIAGHKHLSSTAKYLRRSERGRELVHALGRRDLSDKQFINRGREHHGRNGFNRNTRYTNPARILSHRQHEAWVAEQFLRSRIQPQWRSDGDGRAGRQYR
jgi:integrase/recombinase XerD